MYQDSARQEKKSLATTKGKEDRVDRNEVVRRKDLSHNLVWKDGLEEVHKEEKRDNEIKEGHKEVRHTKKERHRKNSERMQSIYPLKCLPFYCFEKTIRINKMWLFLKTKIIFKIPLKSRENIFVLNNDK